MAILKTNLYIVSGGNHDEIMVEKFNVFLNKGLKIFWNEHNIAHVFVEGAQLLAYAWNSAPITETYTSRLLISVGREFKCPLDFIWSYINLDTPLFSKMKYAKDLTHRLSKYCEVYKVLIDEHRTMHQKYANARRLDLFLFEKGDFYRYAIKYNQIKRKVLWVSCAFNTQDLGK